MKLFLTAAAVLVPLVAGCGGDSQRQAPDQSSPTTSTSTTNPGPLPPGTLNDDVIRATRQAALTLYGGFGSPPVPGVRCQSASPGQPPTFGDCPVTRRLVARLAAVASSGFDVLYAGYSGPDPPIYIGFPTRAGDHSVDVPVTLAVPQAPVVLESIVLDTLEGWRVDDLLFHGVSSRPGSSWKPGVAGGPYSVYNPCFAFPFKGGGPGEGC